MAQNPVFGKVVPFFGTFETHEYGTDRKERPDMGDGSIFIGQESSGAQAQIAAPREPDPAELRPVVPASVPEACA